MLMGLAFPETTESENSALGDSSSPWGSGMEKSAVALKGWIRTG